METWYFIDSKDQSPAYNMALDEKLMDWHREGTIPPVVRFYGWNPPTLSVGYFQHIEKEINMEAVKAHGLGFVRRPTGGRGVLHDDELTYSVIVSESQNAMPDTVTEAYRVISQGLLEGFRNLNLQAEFSIPRSKEEKDRLKRPRSAVCFDAPSWYEMIVEGRKVAGSAQTRQKGVILQHGSIIRSVDVDKLFDLFLYKSDRARERMQKGFHKKAAAINELTEAPVSMNDIKQAFRKGFEKGLDIHLKEYALEAGQKEQVKDLMEKKYDSEAWNFKW
ncbi:lipoate--protein ligase family protein [Salipaludibacillus sp. CUR1]|uniref:lipoate--protein ligase family protein n=1 Tax=Salipaludibacillus sp. CUR1 TaxID=2820003 RepID=UPI001E2CDE8B|nr:biotin/lipoate A/B protein ligase family protein [Salipaludibacillus sp. CUR1]MCE7794307.1 lipoate--protein ligase family protein [Salipaludibacillus sp. CUR1]